MTQLLAPSLIGSAPPVNAPPIVSTGSASSANNDHEPDGAFATLLSEATSTSTGAVQSGETAAPPDGGTPLMPEAPPDAELLAQIAGLLARLQGTPTEGGPDEAATGLSLLDRPAGAGESTELNGTEGASALEALMAYLVMGQQPQQPTTVTSIADVRDLLTAAPSAADTSTSAPAIEVTPQTLTAALEALPEPIANALASVPGLQDAIEALSTPADATGAIEIPVEAMQLPDRTEPAPLIEPAADVPVSEAAMPAIAPSMTSTVVSQQEQASLETAEPISTAPSEADSGDADLPSETPDFAPIVQPRNEGTRVPEAPVDVAPPSVPLTVAGAPIAEAPVAARIANVSALLVELADTVQAAVIRGEAEVRLLLNPPDLGQVEVRIATSEGGLRVHLEASQASARDLMERALPALHQALEARDLRVERIEVRATDTGRGSLDTSGSGEHSNGGGGADREGGQPEWSGVAQFGSFGMSNVGAGKPSQSQAADGRLDVMA